MDKVKQKARKILNYIFKNHLDEKGYGSVEKAVKQMNGIINANDVQEIKKYAGFSSSLVRWYVDDSTEYQSPLIGKFSKLDEAIKKLWFMKKRDGGGELIEKYVSTNMYYCIFVRKSEKASLR